MYQILPLTKLGGRMGCRLIYFNLTNQEGKWFDHTFREAGQSTKLVLVDPNQAQPS